MTLTQTETRRVGAAAAYDALASAYDILTADYSHQAWLQEVERVAKQHGLRGRRLLDIACGTGKSFLPLIERDYLVTACDVSQKMVDVARAKAPQASLFVADMRALPAFGEFDLVTCLDDAINYLLDENELRGFFEGAARNLAPAGVVVFDANSLRLYRGDFFHDWMVDDPAAFIAWTADGIREVEPGGSVAATIHVFEPRGDSWVRKVSRHEQRHWPRASIEDAAGHAGLRVAAVYGQHRGAKLDTHFDELEHHKGLYLVRR